MMLGVPQNPDSRQPAHRGAMIALGLLAAVTVAVLIAF
jgi:hypothetical protein